MWLRGFVVAALLMASNAARAQEPLITTPQWIDRPTAASVQFLYPPDAVNQFVVGEVNLACIVRVDGRLDCRVESETPTGWGFGVAATALSRSYQMTPARRDGVAVEATYSLRIPFRLAGPDDEGDDPQTPWQDLDLPTWIDSPVHTKVEALRPPRLAPGARARGVLGCRIRPDQMLDCEVVREAPRDVGVGAAALEVSRLMRVAGSASFIEKHRSKPFVLPIHFGFPPGMQPVGRFDGAPIQIPSPPPELIDQIYPAAARAAGLEGVAAITCVVVTGQAGRCQVTSERPAGKGFGAAALNMIASAPLEIWQALETEIGLIEGDELRWRIPFELRR